MAPISLNPTRENPSASFTTQQRFRTSAINPLFHIITGSSTVQTQCSTFLHSFRYFRQAKSARSVIFYSLVRGITTNERDSTTTATWIGIPSEIKCIGGAVQQVGFPQTGDGGDIIGKDL